MIARWDMTAIGCAIACGRKGQVAGGCTRADFETHWRAIGGDKRQQWRPSLRAACRRGEEGDCRETAANRQWTRRERLRVGCWCFRGSGVGGPRLFAVFQSQP